MKILLYPFGILYAIINFLRRKLYNLKILRQISFPSRTISIGNITMGGSGKTPLTLHIANHYSNLDKKVLIVLRGYKRKSKGTILVRKESKIDEVGEEALIYKLSSSCDVVVSENRFDAMKVIDYIPDIILLDDGFQHLRVKRDVDLVLIDASNQSDLKPYPYGKAREPIKSLQDADIVIITKGKYESLNEKIKKAIKEKSVFEVEFLWDESFHPSKILIDDLKEKKILLLLGIGNPDYFMKMAIKSGLKIEEKIFFRDHYFPERKDADKALKIVIEKSCDFILTSEKDFIKWSKFEKLKDKIIYPKLKLKISNEERFYSLLKEKVKNG